MINNLSPFENSLGRLISNIIAAIADLMITDDYLERRSKEWQDADERNFYLS